MAEWGRPRPHRNCAFLSNSCLSYLWSRRPVLCFCLFFVWRRYFNLADIFADIYTIKDFASLRYPPAQGVDFGITGLLISPVLAYYNISLIGSAMNDRLCQTSLSMVEKYFACVLPGTEIYIPTPRWSHYAQMGNSCYDTSFLGFGS